MTNQGWHWSLGAKLALVILPFMIVGLLTMSLTLWVSWQLDGGADRLATADVAPEFAKEIFGQRDVGVLPRLVHSRFGLHVVEVLARQPGQPQPFEAVQSAVRLSLQQVYGTALRQFLQLLAGQADLQGVELDASDTPLVQ